MCLRSCSGPGPVGGRRRVRYGAQSLRRGFDRCGTRTRLIELALYRFCVHHTKPEGALVVKLFHGSGYAQLVQLFQDSFKVVEA